MHGGSTVVSLDSVVCANSNLFSTQSMATKVAMDLIFIDRSYIIFFTQELNLKYTKL